MKINLTPAIKYLEEQMYMDNLNNQLWGEGQAERSFRIDSFGEAVRILKEHRKELLDKYRAGYEQGRFDEEMDKALAEDGADKQVGVENE